MEGPFFKWSLFFIKINWFSEKIMLKFVFTKFKNTYATQSY